MLHPRMTPSRRAYLQAVERHGVYEPRHGVAANNCIVLGWVESVLKRPDGSIVRWRDLPYGDVGEWIGQRLTDEGRRALHAHSPEERRG